MIDSVNGILFGEQTPDSLIDALEKCEQRMWDPATIREIAQRYDIHLFQERFLDFLCKVAPSMSEYRLLHRRAG